MNTSCPACDSRETELIRSEPSVPVNSCILLADQVAAQNFPTGTVDFTLCRQCGFCFNSAFDASLASYVPEYEETQANSPRFVEYATDLAERWVTDHRLHGRTVIEIGCGSTGEFLQMLVKAGAGHGIGIDPGLRTEDLQVDTPDHFEWIVDEYRAEHLTDNCSAIVCRHTLEHLGPVSEFMTRLRHDLADRHDVILLFEVPDLSRILDEAAFWDVYYEHSSYFTPGSLSRLFERCGFDIESMRLTYDDQYIVLAASPTGATPDPTGPDDVQRTIEATRHYRDEVDRTVLEWRHRLDEDMRNGRRAVIWGAGSKGVSFITNVNHAAVTHAVDINPVKHGSFLAGSGTPVVSPDDLVVIEPDVIIVMNPIYLEEIRAEVELRGLNCELRAV